MEAPSATSDTFNFVHKIGINDSMIEFTKMIILLAFHDYPQSDSVKAEFIKNKFIEKYGGKWTCCVILKGKISSEYYNYYIQVKHKGYDIIIWKSSL
jgi:hypothetical protein